MEELYNNFINWFRNFGKRKRRQAHNNNRRRCLVWVEKGIDKILLDQRRPLHKIPIGAYPFKYQGELTHLIGIDSKGIYPIEESIQELENEIISPPDVYDALNCDEETSEIWGIGMTMADKIKLGLFILGFLSFLGITFVMAAQFMGA